MKAGQRNGWHDGTPRPGYRAGDTWCFAGPRVPVTHALGPPHPHRSRGACRSDPHASATHPDTILQTGLAFWASKTLLSAIELGVFTELARAPQTEESLRDALGLHPRAARDFLDALVALGFLVRTDGRDGDTPETALFLDRDKPSHVGGILEMANARLYPFRGGLTEALRSGRPQDEIAHGGPDLFDTRSALSSQGCSTGSGIAALAALAVLAVLAVLASRRPPSSAARERWRRGKDMGVFLPVAWPPFVSPPSAQRCPPRSVQEPTCGRCPASG